LRYFPESRKDPHFPETKKLAITGALKRFEKIPSKSEGDLKEGE